MIYKKPLGALDQPKQMAFSHKTQALGNLGADAKIFTSKNGGDPFVTFPLAVTNRYKDGAGEIQEQTDWFDCLLPKGEAQHPHLLKGKQVLLEGRVGVNTYVNDKGETVAKLTLRVNTLTFLGGKDKGASAPATASGQPATTEPDYQQGFQASEGPEDLPF